MAEYEMSRNAHSLHEESGESDSDSDTDSEAYNSLRPPPYSYEVIRDNIVVVEAQNGKQNESEGSAASLKRKGKKKKRWLPFTPKVMETLDIKAVTNLHVSDEPEDLHKNINFQYRTPCVKDTTETADLQHETKNNLPSTSKESNNEQTHEQTSHLQKFQNAWGNFFYRQIQEDNYKNYNEIRSTNEKDLSISDDIKRIWSNDANDKDKLSNQTISNAAFHYIQDVCDSFLYRNSDAPSVQENINKPEFVSYFSDDFDETTDVTFECLEKENEQLDEKENEKLKENKKLDEKEISDESVSNCLSSIEEIMPEDLLRTEILTEFKHFLCNFSNLDKIQQDIFVKSIDFAPILTENLVALYSLRICNSTCKKLVSSKPILEQTVSHSDEDSGDLNLPIEAAEDVILSEKLIAEKLEVKISPSKNTNIVKPYNFVKVVEQVVPKVENKKSIKKVVPIKENKPSESVLSKHMVELKEQRVTTNSATNVENDESLASINVGNNDSVTKSEPNSLGELEIAEMEKTLNELEFDDSSSESDAEFYDKTTKTVSFVILLSKVMYIILIVLPCRNLISLLRYLKSWPFVKNSNVKAIGQLLEVKYKNTKKKIRKFHKMYLRNLINITFCKTALITLVSFQLFSKIESLQPFLFWFYEFYVLVFSVLPFLFTVFELLFLKPLCWLYDILFKGTSFKIASHINKVVFCLVATYYIYKVTNLILKGIRAFLVQPFRKVKKYFKNQYEFLRESLILFQNQTFVTKKERKERDFKTYKMRQIRRRN